MMIEEELGSLLRELELRIALVETTTGGGISARITGVPGSSAYFDRGIVAYSQQAKLDMLQLPPELLQTYGTVSPETTRAMAEAVRTAAGTQIGLAESGIAGPIRGRSSKPPGLCYIALAGSSETQVRQYRFSGDRAAIQAQIAEHALRLLLEYVQAEKEKPRLSEAQPRDG